MPIKSGLSAKYEANGTKLFVTRFSLFATHKPVCGAQTIHKPTKTYLIECDITECCFRKQNRKSFPAMNLWRKTLFDGYLMDSNGIKKSTARQYA